MTIFFLNFELNENVICHGTEQIESHIALEPVRGELVSCSFQQPSSSFSFHYSTPVYCDITGSFVQPYSSVFDHLYHKRLEEELERRCGDLSKGGPIPA